MSKDEIECTSSNAMAFAMIPNKMIVAKLCGTKALKEIDFALALHKKSINCVDHLVILVYRVLHEFPRIFTNSCCVSALCSCLDFCNLAVNISQQPHS